MKVRYLMVLAMAAGFALISASPSWAEEPVTKSQAKRQEKLTKSTKSGQLKKRQANRLKRQQQRLETAKKKAQADGKLAPAEKARLERKQNKVAGQTARIKRNDKTDQN